MPHLGLALRSSVSVRVRVRVRFSVRVRVSVRVSVMVSVRGYLPSPRRLGFATVRVSGKV